MLRSYTIISGTGRAGTTLLMRLLTLLGFDTGYTPETIIVDPLANAGLELDLRSRPDCKIVKSPWIADYIEEVLASGEVAIDHAIICMRPLRHAAESRRAVQAKHFHVGLVPGGLMATDDPARQEEALAVSFHNLIFHLTRHSVPMTFLHFPRFACDADYLAEQLKVPFGDIDRQRLAAVLEREVRPELISDFGRASAASV